MYENYSEVIGKMIHNSQTLRDFLKATPGEPFSFSTHQRDFEHEYFDFLHTDSNEAKNFLQTIKCQVEQQDSQTFIIHGYKGCGKTTLAHYLSQYLSFRNYILTFDSTIDTTMLVRKQLMMHIYNNIIDDMIDECRITKKMLSIFYRNKKNIAFFDRFFDARDTYINFFQLMEVMANTNPNELESIKKRIKEQLQTSFVINELFTILILWDVAFRLINNKGQKCIFIFDNLDVLIHYEPLHDLFNEYSAFCNNCRYLFDNLSDDSLTKTGYNPFQDYTFIFIMRETTKATIIEHFSDRYPNSQSYLEYEVSNLIPKEKILEKRLTYIINSPHVSDHMKKTANDLCELLNDRFLKDNFFSLFNNDYRTSIDTLCEIIEMNDSFVQDYLNIKKNYPHNTSVGSHGLFIRSLCDLFYEKGYLGKFMFTEYTKDKTKRSILSINISRLILTYLKNRCTVYSPKGKKREDINISLLEIFEKFDGICDLHVVIEAIWFMFELRIESFWNHLITFQKLTNLDFSNLEQQLSEYFSPNKVNANYSTIRITPAGRFFLDDILIHFEYYSCRLQISDDSMSLFDRVNATYVKNEFAFETIIRNTVKEVKECCLRLSNYYKVIFQNECQYDDDKFLVSPFAFHKLDIEDRVVNHMFHGERIIHSHINYLDVYRRYVISMIKDNKLKIEANKRLIDYIEQYMNIFGYYSNDPKTHYSDQTIVLCGYYDNCISLIRKSEFTDFKTPIDRKTGRGLEKKI